MRSWGVLANVIIAVFVLAGMHGRVNVNGNSNKNTANGRHGGRVFNGAKLDAIAVGAGRVADEGWRSWRGEGGGGRARLNKK